MPPLQEKEEKKVPVGVISTFHSPDAFASMFSTKDGSGSLSLGRATALAHAVLSPLSAVCASEMWRAGNNQVYFYL